MVLDTNVFVAAGFNSSSHSARIIQAIRNGRVRLVWSRATRDESRSVIQRIPPLSWEDFDDLFTGDDEYEGKTEEEAFEHVRDVTDRKFAALADAAGATLISQDDDLLGSREQADVRVLSPHEFWSRHEGVLG